MSVSWFPDVRAPRPGAAGARTKSGGTGYPSPPEGLPPARAAASPTTRRRPVHGLIDWLIRIGMVARG